MWHKPSQAKNKPFAPPHMLTIGKLKCGGGPRADSAGGGPRASVEAACV